MKGFGVDVERRLEDRYIVNMRSKEPQTIVDRVYHLMGDNGYIDSSSGDEVELDSLDRVGLVIDLEHEFSIDISDEDSRELAPE